MASQDEHEQGLNQDGVAGSSEQSESAEERARREGSFTRRELLRMGWTVPVVAAIGVMSAQEAFAQSGYTDHTDEPHQDAIHADSGHGDYTDHGDHTDHTDVHFDSSGIAPVTPRLGSVGEGVDPHVEHNDHSDHY